MTDPMRPQHHLGGHGLRRARNVSFSRPIRQPRSRFIVKNPRFPPLEACAADPMPKTIYLVGRERIDTSEVTVSKLHAMNPGWNVETFGDMECLQYLEEYWFSEHIAFFNSIPDGDARAGFWVACMMYTHGGCYLHANVVLKKPLEAFIRPGVDVCTIGSRFHAGPRYNPVLIASRPRTKLMARTVGRLLASAGTPFNHNGWFIAFAMSAAARQEEVSDASSNEKGIYTTRVGERLQLLEEAERDSSKFPRKARWNGKRVLLLRAN